MRRGEHVPRAFQAPVDVHASVDGQVYMFRRRQNESADSSEDEEDSNVIELMPRVRQEQDRDGNVQLVERELLDGDNLNKLALQYGCKVADIKRVNNLIQEQDLFALKSIKIPVQKHSFLTETHADPRDWQQETPNSPTPAATPTQDRGGASFKPNVQEYTDFLKEVDHDIEKLIQTTDVQDEAFMGNCDMPRRFGLRGRRLTGYGSDWGIQWWNAVIAMLLIGIILPIFYIVYFKTKDNGVVSTVEESGGIDSSQMSSNSSGTHLSTVGTDHLPNPG